MINLTRLSKSDPWTNVYGLARTLLAIGTLLTLIFNNTDILFIQGVNVNPPECNEATRFSLFCLFSYNLEEARWICILILLVVATGWRPAVTGFFHWWVSYSLNASALIIDGGDAATAVMTFLLLPICLTDDRKWHWSSPKNDNYLTPKEDVKRWVAGSAFFVIKIQVAFIYFNAAVEKFKVTEWMNGTAIYYWFMNPFMGIDHWLRPLLASILPNPFVVTIITWGTLAFELSLFLAIFLKNKYQSSLLKMGIIFHFLIALFFGLIPFFFAMSSALLLYLRPLDKEIFVLNKSYLKSRFLSSKV